MQVALGRHPQRRELPRRCAPGCHHPGVVRPHAFCLKVPRQARARLGDEPCSWIWKLRFQQHVDRAFYCFLRAIQQSGAAWPGQPVLPREGRVLGSGPRREAGKPLTQGPASRASGLRPGNRSGKDNRVGQERGSRGRNCALLWLHTGRGGPRLLATPEEACLGK